MFFISGESITHFVSYTETHGWRGKINNFPIPNYLTTSSSVSNVLDFLTEVATSRLCEGNVDIEIQGRDHRSQNCEVTLQKTAPESTKRCGNCSTYRGTLRKMHSRAAASVSTTTDKVNASSKTPFTVLTKPELVVLCRNLSASRKHAIRENQHMKRKINDILARNSTPPEAVSADVSELCLKTISYQISQLPVDSIKRLFLEEQLKAVSAAKATGRRWHPTILRWCLIMHKKSSTLYRYMRESGFICLPSERTLSDYRAYKPTNSGVDSLYILECADKFGAQDVAVLIDEMKVREGLVYNSSSGELWGYIDTDESDHLLDGLTNGLSSADSTSTPPLASHALCFMLRGLKSSNQAVVATFGTHCMTAEKLYNRFWEVVSRLEFVSFRVRCCVSDGASINRKVYKLHSKDFPDDAITYRAINRYSESQRTIFFVSDSCLLMKTSCNGYDNSGSNRNSRKLVVSRLSSLLNRYIYIYI